MVHADRHAALSWSSTTARKEEEDRRRERGQLACAECQRLKTKCDRKVPCSSCIRRGCQSICPTGSAPTGRGVRSTIDTDTLRTQVIHLTRRIHQLEEALAALQATISPEPHPLLQHQQQQQAEPIRPISAKAQHQSEDAEDKLVEALGTLTISGGGQKYFGRSGGSEPLLLSNEGEETDQRQVPHEIQILSNSFPLEVQGGWDIEASLQHIYRFLPDRYRAWSLCETYFAQAYWAFRPVRRDEIIDDILTPLYHAPHDEGGHVESSSTSPPPLSSASSASAASISPHQVAVLFFVFALGALVDLTLPARSNDSETYFQLGRAAMSLRSVFENPDMATVQAVALMSAYHQLAGGKYTIDSAWLISGLGMTLAKSIGLHRDSAKWGMDTKTVERRRRLFWELFSSDNFHCLAMGRPPALRTSYLDCRYPEVPEPAPGEATESAYALWKFGWAKEVYPVLIETTLAAGPLEYSTVLELDRKVSEYPYPTALNQFAPEHDATASTESPMAYFERCLATQFRAAVSLYIHRGFFAKALVDHPDNPLRSPYARSFTAAYRGASDMIRSVVLQFDRYFDLNVRWWDFFSTRLFSAAVVAGFIVTRAPACSVAAAAFEEFKQATAVFDRASEFSRRARSGQVILKKLKAKAVTAYSEYQAGLAAASLTRGIKKEHDDEEDFVLFSGGTHLMVKTEPSTASLSSFLSADPNPGASSDPDAGAWWPNTAAVAAANSPESSASTNSSGTRAHIPDAMRMVSDVHPSLVDYFQLSQYASEPPAVRTAAWFAQPNFNYDPAEDSLYSTTARGSGGTGPGPSITTRGPSSGGEMQAHMGIGPSSTSAYTQQHRHHHTAHHPTTATAGATTQTGGTRQPSGYSNPPPLTASSSTSSSSARTDHYDPSGAAVAAAGAYAPTDYTPFVPSQPHLSNMHSGSTASARHSMQQQGHAHGQQHHQPYPDYSHYGSQ